MTNRDKTVKAVAAKLHDRMYDTLVDTTYPSGAHLPLSVIEEMRMRRWDNAQRLAREVVDIVLGED